MDLLTALQTIAYLPVLLLVGIALGLVWAVGLNLKFAVFWELLKRQWRTPPPPPDMPHQDQQALRQTAPPTSKPAAYCSCGARLEAPGAYCIWCGQGDKRLAAEAAPQPSRPADGEFSPPTAVPAPTTAAPPSGGNNSVLAQPYDYDKAPLLLRLYALLLDACIAFLPFLLTMINLYLLWQLVVLLSITYPMTATFLYMVGTIQLMLGAVISLTWIIGYHCIKDGLARGTSYGKQWFGLMVVHLATNSPCSLKKAFVRALPRLLLPALAGLDYWLVWFGQRGQTTGDLLAGTQVILTADYAGSGARELHAPLLTYPKAPPALRVSATLYDLAVSLAPLFIFYFSAALGTITLFLVPARSTESLLALLDLEIWQWVPGLIALGLLACLFWAILYHLGKDGLRGGASLGKQRCGLMVVHLPSHTPCTLSRSCLRAATTCVPLLQLLDGALPWLSPSGRTAGDHLAATQVIETKKFEENRRLPTAAPPLPPAGKF